MRLRLRTTEGDVYNPYPTQALFHASQATYRAFIGGFGNGKSMCGAAEMLVNAVELPGSKWVVARYDWGSLANTSWQVLLDIIPKGFIASATSRPPVINLVNGSQIIGYNLKKRSKAQMRSLQLSGAWLDEVNEDGITEEHFKELIGRCRSPKGRGRIWMTGNPAGRNWVYQRFFAHQFDSLAKKWPDHEGFRARTQENKHLPEVYLQHMRDNYDEEWLAKFMEGDFDVFEGQILDNFRTDIHVIDPFPIPREWPRFRALDHGLTAPTACLWAACDFQGRLYIYNEYYKKESVIEVNVGAINDLSGVEDYEWTVIDPSTRQRQQQGGQAEALIDQYRTAGLICREGNNDFRAAVTRLRTLLAPSMQREYPPTHRLAGTAPAPGLFIFNTCRSLIWEFSGWRWKDASPGTLLADREYRVANHACAAARYMVMESPYAAFTPEVRERARMSVWDQIAADLQGDEWPEARLRSPAALIR